MWKKWLHYCTDDLWNFRLEELSGWKKCGCKWLRIAVLSVQGFFSDKSTLRASSLTFYTLMSIVPVIAMMFAIARGFGYQDYLRAELLVKFKEQQTALMEIITFAEKLLAQTHEGLIAGIGLILLFWSVASLLGSMEEAFNSIWNVHRMRSWRRLFTDYFALMMTTPFLFILSSSITLFVVNNMDEIVHKMPIGAVAISTLSFFIQIIPYALFWLLFSFLYVFMPNIKVKASSAMVGGVVAAILYVMVQWGYIYFQVGVNRYGAIYGSFAALPLFLIWLQVSWFILLFGAEVSYAHQTQVSHEFEPALKKASPGFRKMVTLWIAQLAVSRFQQRNKPITLEWIVHHCRIPASLAAPLLEELIACHILVELKSGALVPARAADQIRISDVLTALETRGASDFPFIRSKELERFKGLL
jgi:membrane protein